MFKRKRQVAEESEPRDSQTTGPTRKSLRLWPGVAAVVLQWLLWFGLPLIDSSSRAGYISAISGLIGGLVVVLWWVFFSRAPRLERWGALVLMIAAVFATSRILHESVAKGGMGLLFYVYVMPGLSFAFVLWAVVTRHLTDRTRRATMVVTILLACGAWGLVRTRGVTADGSDFTWRWTQTYEERLLALGNDEPKPLSPVPETVEAVDELPAEEAPEAGLEVPAGLPADVSAEVPSILPEVPALAKTVAEWPGFRGPHRNGVIPHVRIETDWSASPPVELWRRPIGPGWSSFAVDGDLLYTQEQRGEDELVACYQATTGEPVWRHRDAARFWESNAGAGPRATPTLSDGRVYSFGATGILNVLDARSGTVVWSRNVASDTAREVPYWGFSSSPLVIDDVVIVAAAGRLVAYDLATGDRRWFGPDGGNGYSSPHLLTIDGVPQVLLLSSAGATSVSPADGALLWQHKWDGFGIVQPALTEDGDLLIGADMVGMLRMGVRKKTDGWTIQERWKSIRLKPYFNDFVVHKEHAFGIDGSFLTCINLADGERRWKGGRVGQGQLVLLPDQDLLLVVSEKGELALVSATPDRFTELARFKAIEGKTWNHPVLIDDVLLVRNGQEMAAFRLSRAGN